VSIISSIAEGAISGIITPLFSWLNKVQDTKLETHRIETQADIAVVEARAKLAWQGLADSVNKWGRRGLIYPTLLYYTLIVYDSCFRNILPDYTWRVLELPSNVQYIPHAVVAYLLVTAWRKP
jgi:hypothetical protein